MHKNNSLQQKNVLGEKLEFCCHKPKTGYLRDGYCHIIDADQGSHTICIEVTNDFLNFQKKIGNDLNTPVPEFNFPGLQDGDRWCVCASRVKQAIDAAINIKILLRSTNEKALEYISLTEMKKYAIDIS
jgi:uncharacterized protein (DUF2237 family)